MSENAFNEQIENHSFYVVSNRKFATLFIATFGIYFVYWFYRNWKAYKATSKENINPFLRTIFSYFYIHSLFAKIYLKIQNNGTTFKWRPSANATTLIILMIVANGLERTLARNDENLILELIVYLLLAPKALILLKAQSAINISCGDEVGASNDSFTKANIAWILLGAAVWGIIITDF